MTEQYWVGDFFVDVTRNQITKKAQSQKIPPKALAVLTCLAKNANKVVSHDDLLSEVWSETIVTPNTLQRSIAQLRKALGEDSQFYIKTHAKQGYSLEVEVRWQDKPGETIETATTVETNTTIATDETTPKIAPSERVSKKALSLITALIAMIILVFFGFNALTPANSLKLDIAEFNSLTATDHKEYSGIYSPDGQYVVFQRYSDKVCRNNNIWAKNIKTQQEIQLTKSMGAYGSHSFSKDGNSLVFIESDNCDKPITQKRCYKLMTLDFHQALTEPQSPTVLVECKNSRIARAKWLNNNNIALLQGFSNRWKLTSFSIEENNSTVIYELEEGNVIDYDYSTEDDLIALTRIHSDGQQYIDILKSDGQKLSSNKIEFPKEVPANRFIYPNFTPYTNQLIFSTGRQLFTLSYEGKVANISLPLHEPISSPIFHINGKRMLVIKGHYDSDIALIPLEKIAHNDHDLSQNTTIIERSTKGEDHAKFQPNGKLIAYTSNRSGRNQLWITDGKSPKQLSHFPIDSFLYELNWAADGKSILINANQKLTQIYLNSRTATIDFAHPIQKLFQWNSESNTALVIARIKGILKFAELDLNNGTHRVINDKKVHWAVKSEDGQLIYLDNMDQFWQSGPVEDQRIASLIDQGSDNGFIIKNNTIYGINEKFQLWSYTLNDEAFNIIGNVPQRLDYITDINQTEILFTLRIAAKKEVAEIILAD
ncbi:winged helix-turn-helix domain-containing protein [Litorilituus lipolyticus]|uniref:Transcriptional regulator n=1 Tax=Litorilituus lipolyticus TaxID=2491017 RepID=A0A502KNW9_9GAMM|nr:winged helix-turn-helix domain-containing protein [Litorilituus lipolyticus]TPH13420.1 transcriptional regulator [Litorilituus lipolyticus]